MPNDQRRFQVFVSSTYRDLIEARQNVTVTLLESEPSQPAWNSSLRRMTTRGR